MDANLNEQRMATSIHHEEMLEVNEFLVLDFVRQHGQTTRPAIGRALNLAPSTVGRMVSRLVADGAVIEHAERGKGRGRPARRITFNRQAGCVLAIDLGGTLCRGVLADLGGEILDRDSRPSHGPGGGPFEALLASVAALRGSARQRELPIRSLAIGVPAVIEPESLLGYGGPAVAWAGFELVPKLAQAVDVPFIIENDVNLAALGHAWRGSAQRVRDFVTLSIGTGVGGGIVTGGRLLKGRYNAGGEMGAFITDREQLHRRPPLGGMYEAIASGPALIRRVQQLLDDDLTRRRRRTSELMDGDITPQRIFDAAAAGDAVARQVVDELVENTAVVMIGISAVVDPEVVVLDGGVGRAMGPYVSRLGSLMEDRLPRVPRVVISNLGPDSTVVGAIAAGLQVAMAHSAPGALFGTFSVADDALRHPGASVRQSADARSAAVSRG